MECIDSPSNDPTDAASPSICIVVDGGMGDLEAFVVFDFVGGFRFELDEGGFPPAPHALLRSSTLFDPTTSTGKVTPSATPVGPCRLLLWVVANVHALVRSFKLVTECVDSVPIDRSDWTD